MKNKNFLARSLAFTFISIISFCATSESWDSFSILSAEDIQQEYLDRQDRPALSSVPDDFDYWESYNEWKCFSHKDIRKFECTEVGHRVKYVPTLRVSDGHTLYDFSLDPEPGLSCHYIIMKWIQLIDKEEIFCVYTAFLQNLNENLSETDLEKRWSLWIVDRIKSKRGYWTYGDDDALNDTQ